MFDVVSFIREKIFRRPKLKSENIVGEELTEKQTTKLGYFLLICMFMAIMTSAQWTLGIIKNIPSRPTDIPNCVEDMVETFRGTKTYYTSRIKYNDSCMVYSSENPEFNFNPEYQDLYEIYQKIRNLRIEIKDFENEKSKISYSENDYQDDYNTSLTEKIANEDSGLYDTTEIQNKIKNNRDKIETLENQINNSKEEINEIIKENSDDTYFLEQKYEKAQKDYKVSYLLYKTYIAILSFIFSITVFSILYKIYVRQKIKNSPHTIIFSFATFAYGLVLLQVSAVFIWDILPHKMIEIVLSFLSAFTPFLFLLQFLWPVIIIAIFGVLVYKIQKRLYSQANVLKRFISDKKCPGCGNTVELTKPFCPLCSYEIQIKCPKCKNLTLKGMPYCSSCREKLDNK